MFIGGIVIKACISSNLPDTVKGYIEEAMVLAYGEGVIELVLLDTNLKSTVRYALKNSSIVLVVLSKEDNKECEGIDNGLFVSSKYTTYTNNSDLVGFLNSKFDIQLSVKEDTLNSKGLALNEGISNSLQEELIAYKNEVLALKGVIKSYEARLKDMEGIYTVSSEDLEDVLTLKDELLGITKDYNSLKTEYDALKGYKDKYNEIDSLYKANLAKYKDLKNSYNTLLSDSQNKTTSLSNLEGNLSTLNSKYSDLELKYGQLLEDSAKYKNSVSNLEALLKAKKLECSQLKDEVTSLKSTGTSVNVLEGTVSELNSEVESLMLKNSNKDVTINTLNSDIEEYKSKIDELNTRINQDDVTIAELNRQLMDLQNKVSSFEATGVQDDGTSLYDSINILQDKLVKYSSSIYGNMLDNASAKKSYIVPSIPLVNPVNIRFVYAGTDDSKKGTLSCLKSELSKVTKKTLLLDLSNEPMLDYVFGLTNIKNKSPWYLEGGSLASYMSDTNNTNLKVVTTLSMGNDYTLLNVPWEERLSELVKSGYNVVVYAGSLSTSVVRVLYESFSIVGVSDIYVLGSVLNARNVIVNTTNLKNLNCANVKYFNFSAVSSSLYNIMAKKCKSVVKV